MPVYELGMFGVGLLLTIGTGFFVASEFSLVNLNRSDLESRVARGEKRLGLTIGALKITSTHLSSAQLGITLTTLLTGYTMEPAIGGLLAAPLAGLGFTTAVVTVTASVLAIVIATLLSWASWYRRTSLLRSLSPLPKSCFHSRWDSPRCSAPSCPCSTTPQT
jgi:CBS domain containing-hemolysin-like protein